jgi:uncharacterized protein YuzE
MILWSSGMVQSASALTMTYDRDADVLYCSFGEARAALSIERDNGVVLRVDPESQEVVGITIIYFFKRFAEHPNEGLRVPLQVISG